MMSKHTALWLALFTLTLALTPTGSFADRARVVDRPARDSESAFDIDWIKHGHSGKKLTHVISTHDTWRSSDLGDNGKFQINIAPGADGGQGVTRIIVIYLDRGKLESTMYKVFDGSEVVGHPPVTRPTSRAVKVTFPKRFIRRGCQAYRWDALFAEQMTEDTVPSDESSILHRLN